MIKEKPVKYKLKKGVKWENVKEVFRAAALTSFDKLCQMSICVAPNALA